MKKIAIKTDCTKNYYSAMDALQEMEYKEIGTITYSCRKKDTTRPLLEKDNKQYAYLGMDHFNTTINKVFLGDIETLVGNYWTNKFN